MAFSLKWKKIIGIADNKQVSVSVPNTSKSMVDNIKCKCWHGWYASDSLFSTKTCVHQYLICVTFFFFFLFKTLFPSILLMWITTIKNTNWVRPLVQSSDGKWWSLVIICRQFVSQNVNSWHTTGGKSNNFILLKINFNPILECQIKFKAEFCLILVVRKNSNN